jgi:hypothetical protein
MWSDTLLAAERAQLLRLAVWSALSIVAGTSILALLSVRRLRSALLSGFAFQMLGWGIALIAWCGISLHALAPRDLAAATRLERFVWMGTGLDLGCIGIGLTLALAARRLGAVGAGVGIAFQGAALLVLNVAFTQILNRLV